MGKDDIYISLSLGKIALAIVRWVGGWDLADDARFSFIQ
jgi:hypothetical protein